MTITKPTLIIDQKKCKQNIEQMVAKAKKHGLLFRPHFKTHQSLDIGHWFKDFGVTKITVSSLTMASYFSKDWDDITVAFPTNILEIDTINTLAKKITLSLSIENEESVLFLSKHLKHNVNVFLKTDVGYHRTGLNPIDTNTIDTILDIINNNPLLHFVGFLGHSGHTYNCKTKACIKKIHAQSLQVMVFLKKMYAQSYPNLITSLGDTPSCSVSKDFSGIDEIRPGNFVFYDLTQNQIGANSIAQIAVAMASPIVAIHNERSEIVVYCGGVHLSKDRLIDGGKTIFSKISKKTKTGWGDLISNAYVKSLSQEHGVISMPKDEIVNYNIGDVLMILPVHSCMAANLMESYMTIDGHRISKL